MKLYLDDERDTPDGWVRAYTCEGCISLLETELVSELSLDHDLGTSTTGYDVVKWLEEQAHNGRWNVVPKSITVHSANPVGRQRMEQAIASIDKMRG